MPLIRTCTFEDVRKKWASLSGLDHTSVGTDDANVFIELFNSAFSKVWISEEFNFNTDVEGFLVDSRSAVDLSANSTVRDILDVYDTNPYYNDLAKPQRYMIQQDNVYVPQIDAATAVAVTSLVSTSTTATCTTTAVHGYSTDDTVVVSGADQSEYNGTFRITVTSTTVFTYVMDSDPSVDTATGTLVLTKTPVFLYYRTQETDFDGTLTTTLPFVLKNYLAFQVSADFLASEGQESKSIVRQQKAEEHKMDLIENYERSNQQFKPVRVSTRVVGSN